MYFLESRGNGGYYQLTKVMQREAFAKMGRAGTPLEDQWLRVCLPIEGVPVPSLVGELRSHMSPGQKKKNKTQNRSNLLTNSVKTSKLVHIKLSLKK